MNKDNILRVADAIENRLIEDLGFNMIMHYGTGIPDKSGHNCGSAACISGWAAAIMTGEKDAGISVPDSEVSEWLGIDDDQADELFYLSGMSVPEGVTLNTATQQQAIDTLRRLAQTGEVRWSEGK